MHPYLWTTLRGRGRNGSDAPEVLDGSRSRVITETIFSQNIKGGSSATNQVSAQPSSTLQTLSKSVQEKLITNISTVNFSCPSNFLSRRNFCLGCNPLRQLSRNTYWGLNFKKLPHKKKSHKLIFILTSVNFCSVLNRTYDFK